MLNKISKNLSPSGLFAVVPLAVCLMLPTLGLRGGLDPDGVTARLRAGSPTSSEEGSVGLRDARDPAGEI